MINLFVRFTLLGAALMVGVLAVGLGYRYLLIAPALTVAPRMLGMMTVGAITTGMGVALLRSQIQEFRSLLASTIRLLQTVVGVTCIATTLGVAALLLEELMSVTPPDISFAQAATMILIGGGITGLALFFMDARSRAGG